MRKNENTDKCFSVLYIHVYSAVQNISIFVFSECKIVIIFLFMNTSVFHSTTMVLRHI